MKLALIFSSLLLLVFSDTNYQLDYLQLNEKCLEAEDNKDQCLSVNLNNNAYQCCMITVTTTNSDRDDEKSSSCIISISDISLLTKVYNNAMFKAQIREIFGYLKHGLYFTDEDGKKNYLQMNQFLSLVNTMNAKMEQLNINLDTKLIQMKI